MKRLMVLIAAVFLLNGSVLLTGNVNAADLISAPQSSQDNLFGNWREHWGIPGHTDVTYNDRYRVSRGSGGQVQVEITSRDQRIWDIEVRDGILSFKQRTDTLTVQYRLHLPGKERWMIGSATTPRGSYPIIWAKTD